MRRLKGLPLPRRKLVVGCGGLLILFLVINAFVYFMYHGRSYPHTTIAGKPLGSVSTKQLSNRVSGLHVLPAEITLTHDNKPTKLSLSDLGVSLDLAKTAERIQHQRHWLPLLNLVTAHHVELYLRTDTAVLKKAAAGLVPIYTKSAVDAAIVVGANGFELHKEADGYQLNTARIEQVITGYVAQGKTTIPLPTTTLKPKITTTSLGQSLHTLQAQQNIALTFRYQGQVAKPNAQQIANWYDLNGPAFSLNDTKIKSYITLVGNSFGIGVQNAADAIAAVKTATQNGKPLDFTLVARPTRKTFSYCVAARGVDATSLATLRAKLRAVYADERGWGLSGQLGFNEVASGCDFTVWLTAAQQMTTFGPGCDTTWSCTVPPHVIINFDRWLAASPAWNQSGGNLEDYRSMVINHETGHWLSFGHRSCGGPGQPAPVMQQQSIDLQGCSFNPWPLSFERDALRVKLQL